MAEKKETVEAKKKLDINKWKQKKLKAINEMKDEAKAKAIAERIMKVRG